LNVGRILTVTSLRWNPLVVVVVRLANHREGASAVADFPPSPRDETCDLRRGAVPRPVLAKLLIFFSHDAQPMSRGCRHLPKTLQRRKDDPECPIDSRVGTVWCREEWTEQCRWGHDAAIVAHLDFSTPRHATHGVSPAELPHEHQHERQHAHSCARRRLLDRST
jgi:hypothetical protein